MTSNTLEIESILSPDRKATRLCERYLEWDTLRQQKKNDWEEITRYIFATSTKDTTNSQLPWKNSTSVPKICQIRDNLYSNYTATLFPQRKSIVWEANEKDANSKAKRDAITNYMNWVISQPMFKHEMDKVVLDYIDKGNCFVTAEWVDERVVLPDGRTQAGYIGPVPRRISPLDTVMNPTAESYKVAPKFVRTIISLGELKKYLNKLTNTENREEYEELWNYLRKIRSKASEFNGDFTQKDKIYSMEGFSSFRAYLMSDYCEVLTFYGDYYDIDSGELQENRVVTIVDRHKLINDRPNASFFGYAPIFHAPWRKRQDNLWGMGPLDNLIGMQYRMDHVENMKADVFDLITYPVQKVKGFVEDFTWQPGEKIFVSEEGDVELVVPDVNALNANLEIQNLERLMEEMAGAPREAMGFRTPGEKTKYEVQRLENASARLFQNKIKQFEEQILEPLLNAMLELACRNMTGVQTIRVMDNEFNLATFQSLTVEDITGIGRIKPVGARHFAEQAELIQNLTNLTGSGLWPFIQQHFSSFTLAKIVEEVFNLKEYEVVQENVALSDHAEAQKQANSLQEQVFNSAGTPTGRGPDFAPSSMPQMPGMT